MRPFIHKLTKSELHAVMTGGFATVAGSYIALLVEVGVRMTYSDGLIKNDKTKNK